MLIAPEKREHSSQSNPQLRLPRGPLWSALMVVFFLVVVAATGGRIAKEFKQSQPGKFDWDHLGYCDFQMGVYQASSAFRDGVNPFGPEFPEKYPVERQLPLYSPLMFLVHLPLTYLPLKLAAVLHFVFNLTLAVLIALFTLRFSQVGFHWSHVVGLATFILITRAGHTTAFTGYVTFELVLGTMFALHFGTQRPWLGGVGLLIAGFKPTYAIPLVVLMLCRRQVKAVTIGVVLACVALGLGLAYLATHSSWSDVLTSIGSTQETHISQESEKPVNSWTRLDTLAIVAKWWNLNPTNRTHLLVMIPFLAIGGFAVIKWNSRERDDGAVSVTALLICLTMMVSLYRHSYDALLLIPPLFGLLCMRPDSWNEISKLTRVAIVAIGLIVLFSYWSSNLAFGILNPSPTTWQWVTSLNGILLFCAFLMMFFETVRGRTPASGPPQTADHQAD